MIECIRQFDGLMRQAEAAVLRAGLQWRAKMGAPASDSAIESLKAGVEVDLPESYLGFLRLHDGLYVEAGDDSYRLTIFSAADALAYSRDAIIWCGHWAQSDWIVLNSAFRKNGEYAVLAGAHDESGAMVLQSQISASSFGEFLQRIMNNIISGNEHGACYWLNDPGF